MAVCGDRKFGKSQCGIETMGSTGCDTFMAFMNVLLPQKIMFVACSCPSASHKKCTGFSCIAKNAEVG